MTPTLGTGSPVHLATLNMSGKADAIPEGPQLKLRLSILAFMCALCAPALAADTAAGKAKYGICVACHGADGAGNAALNAPAIAGQEAWYVESQIKLFKGGQRGTHAKDLYGKQMRPMAMVLTTDAAVVDVSAYVASLPPAAITHKGGGDAAKGKTLFATCAACHGANGKGNPALKGPDLTLQQDWYVVRQLANFKAGIRGSDPKDTQGMQMRPMSMMLANEQAMKDVAAYIVTLK